MNLDFIHDAIVDWEEPFDGPVYYIVPRGTEFDLTEWNKNWGVLYYTGPAPKIFSLINLGWF